MSTATNEISKRHIDGGTYRNVAWHNSRRGWAVAITKWTTKRGHDVFEVARVNPQNVAFVFDRANSEEAARNLANREWMTQMGRLAEWNLSQGHSCGCGALHTGRC